MTEEIQTREALRRQNQQQQASQQPPRRWHWFNCLLAVLAALFFLLAWWGKATIFSEQAAKTVATQPTVVSAVKSELNSGLEQYGLTNVVRASDTKKLLKEVVGAVYKNRSIQLDVSSITNRLSNSASSELSLYGVSVPSALQSGVSSTVETAINNQLNNSQVQEVRTVVTQAKLVDNIALAVAGVFFLICALFELFRHTLWRFLATTLLVAGGLFASGVLVANSYLQQFNYDDAIVSAIVTSATETVISTGQHLAILVLVLGAIALIVTLLLRRRRRA